MAASVSTWMDDCISMSISGDSPSDETLNLGAWHCSCSDSINFPLGLCIVLFSFFFSIFCSYDLLLLLFFFFFFYRNIEEILSVHGETVQRISDNETALEILEKAEFDKKKI